MIRAKTGQVPVLQCISKAFHGKHFQLTRNPSFTDPDPSGRRVFIYIKLHSLSGIS